MPLTQPKADLIVGDVSFISMTLILPQLPALLADGGDLLLLVKPQFEVGPGNVGKSGIVRQTRRFIAKSRTTKLTARTSWASKSAPGWTAQLPAVMATANSSSG